MAPPFSLPSKPTFTPDYQPTQRGGAHAGQYAGSPTPHFANLGGYQPSHFTNGTGYSAGYSQPGPSSHNEARNYQAARSAPSALVNPYAPHINYNILPLPPVVSQGNGRATTARGFGLPPQPNGVGTFGPIACTSPGCCFRGQKKDVTFHMMDRHLIFPPGWKDNKRKRRDDGEDIADEERDYVLKGSTIIPGTTIALDTPEAIEAWKAERRKRWPSAQRIEEKQRARQAAIDRGEIIAGTRRNSTKQGRGGRGHEHHYRGHERGGRSQGGRGRGRGRGGLSNVHRLHSHADEMPSPDNGWVTRAKQHRASTTLPNKSSSSPDGLSEGSNDSSVSDGAHESGESGSDIDLARDAVSSRPPINTYIAVGPDAANPAALHVNFITKSSTVDSKDMPACTTNPEVRSEAINQGPAGIVDTTPPDHPQNTQDPLRPSPAQEVRTQQCRSRHDPGPRQPRTLPRNPFTYNRPSLLRNLLLPDIRSTVSSLSQAIRFLVANDFLENVELKAGEAANPMIQVLKQPSSPESDEIPPIRSVLSSDGCGLNKMVIEPDPLPEEIIL